MKKTTGPTPAPWRIIPTMGGAYLEIRSDSVRDPIAQLYPTVHGRRAYADASLVSAAPELLDVLKEIVQEIEEADPESEDSPLLKEARAVIAKAERTGL